MKLQTTASVRALLIAGGLVGIGVLAGFAESESVIADDALATYWGCESGFTFERNGLSMVRCRKPGSVDARALAPCPSSMNVNGVAVGLSASDDYSGPTDMCVGFPSKSSAQAPAPPPITAARVCTTTDLANGWIKVIRVGLDRCEKTIPETIDFPRSQVQR